jgi:hypothetical protein
MSRLPPARWYAPFVAVTCTPPIMVIAKSPIIADLLKPGSGTLTVVQPTRQKPSSTGTSLSAKSSSTGDKAVAETLCGSAYSDLKLFTGLAIAALMACQLTVSRVSAMAPAPASAKIHQDNVA